MKPNIKKRAIFFDRDGVIIENRKSQINSPLSIRKFEDIKLVYGIQDIVSWLSNKFLIIIISNQPDIARGLLSRPELDKINSYLKKEIKIDDIFCCLHDDKDNCECRKPKVGLINMALKKYPIDLSHSYLIGDRWKDMKTALNAGCKSIFLDYKYEESKKVKFNYDYKIENIAQIKGIIN